MMSRLKQDPRKLVQEAFGLLEAKGEYQGKSVTLDKPYRTPGESKKFKVYVKNDKGNVVLVRFGQDGSEAQIDTDDPKARAAFRARHKCDQQTDKTSAAYWSCKAWSASTVSKGLGLD